MRRSQAELKDKPVLRGDGDEIAVIVRQYFADRTKEVPLTLNIMRVDANAPKLLRHFLDRNFFAEGARRALANLEFTMENTLRAHNGISMLSFNHFVNGNGTNLFPTLDNRYMVAYFDNLAVPEKEDDAPVILIRRWVVWRGPLGALRVDSPTTGACEMGRAAKQQNPQLPLLFGVPVQPLARVARLRAPAGLL